MAAAERSWLAAAYSVLGGLAREELA